MRFIFALVLYSLILLGSIPLFADSNQPYSNFRVSVFCDSTNNMQVEGVKDLLKNNRSRFIAPNETSDFLNARATYWYYMERVDTVYNTDYVLSFQVWVSLIGVYPYPYSYTSGYGGRMVNYQEKDLPDCSVVLSSNAGSYLVKVQNKVFSYLKPGDFDILPVKAFRKKQQSENLMHGIAVGILLIILVYNLVLYFWVKNKMHIYYLCYILLNLLFILFTFSYSEIIFFPNNYKLNFILLPLQLISVFFYIMFFRKGILNHCTIYTIKTDRRTFLPFAYIMLVTNIVIGSSVFYNMNFFVIGLDISNMVASLIAIPMVIYFYKRSDWFIRTIVYGSVFMIVFGWFSAPYALLNITSMNLFYATGLIIEMMFFTFALNKLYFEDKFETELAKQKLERELENKNRELVYQAIQLSAKEEAMVTIKNTLKEFGVSGIPENLASARTLLNNSTTDNLWKEFELHFNETHPGFYRALMEKYPGLTQGEIRLCAFLKLNLNTKEIALITRKSAHSIEVMRSRVRTKMNLERDSNLSQTLTTLE